MMIGTPPASAAIAAAAAAAASPTHADNATGNPPFSNTTDALHTIAEGDQTEDGAEAASTAAASSLPPSLRHVLKQ
jgi:hypothetical protein